MKIKIRQLLPNPFRNLGGAYPIDQKKVEALAASIRTTGIWENLIARRSVTVVPEHKNTTRTIFGYELAYGHHRLAAFKMLVQQQLIDDDYELDLPVRHLDDAAMVRIMLLENPIDRRAVDVALQYVAQAVREPVSVIKAEDITQFVGGDWHDHLKQIRGILKKLRTKESPAVLSSDYENF